jgi:hypothetical protein
VSELGTTDSTEISLDAITKLRAAGIEETRLDISGHDVRGWLIGGQTIVIRVADLFAPVGGTV